jgi:hypothetical protein
METLLLYMDAHQKVEVQSPALLTISSMPTTCVVDAQITYDQLTFRCNATTSGTTNLM